MTVAASGFAPARPETSTPMVAIAAAQADPEFRWFEESAWTVDAWREAHRDDAKALDAFKALLKEGRISVGAAWCNPHAAMFSEHLGLLFFHLDAFERDAYALEREASGP